MGCDSSNLAQRLQNLERNLPSLLGHSSVMNLPHNNFYSFSVHPGITLLQTPTGALRVVARLAYN
jgi:hypothetical protein